MLSPGDARLVQRDPELPALGHLLDPDVFVEWLQHHLAVRITAVQPHYVRYKPGTSCLVAYTVEWRGGSVVVTAKAFRPPAANKLAKAAQFLDRTSAIGPAAIVASRLALVAVVFPHDLKLRSLHALMGPAQRRVLRRLFPGSHGAAQFSVLSYKPERRFVARLDRRGRATVIRVYRAGQSIRIQDIAMQPDGVRLARTVASHPRYPIVATEWIEGEDGTTAFSSGDRAAAIGEALARLHNAPERATWTRTSEDEGRQLRSVAAGLADLMPKHAARLNHLSGAIGDALVRLAPAAALTHGDFAARQVVFAPDGVAFTDLDAAAAADPGVDIGSFLADLDYRVVRGQLDQESAARTADRFLDGYRSVRVLPRGLEIHHAAHLLRVGPLPFRTRVSDWRQRTEVLLDRCQSVASRAESIRLATNHPASSAPGASLDDGAGSDPVTNADASTFDSTMPWLNAALDPVHVSRLFRDLAWVHPEARVQSARVRRHKPGRRCVIEYDVTGATPRVFGKTRAKGLDRRTADLVGTLYADGFGASSHDGIEVPQFLGVLPSLRMWLQSATAGEPAGEVIGRGVAGVAERLVAIVIKLQRLGPTPDRTHALVDEVRILQERLAALANRRPALRDQLTRVFEGCQRLAATLPDVPLVPAHRDFYPDQVVVDGSRVVLLDLDLYSLAHPALDVGNCIAHLVELGFRRPHRATLFDDAAQTMREAMAAAISASAAPGIDAFVTLTLARLVDIDDRFDDRRGCVLPLLEECERRLAQAQVLPPPRASVAV